MPDCEEDPDFVDSNHNFESEQDDIEYNRHVIDGMEIGMDDCQDEVQDQREEGCDNELELPSSEELLPQCSSDEDGSYHFPEFFIDQDLKNP